MRGLRALGSSFNEATLFQAWKARAKPPMSSNSRGFNEATLFQAWKGPNRCQHQREQQRASMRPRFFKRGKRFINWLIVAGVTGFNEATLFQAWKAGRYRKIPEDTCRFNEATLFQAWKGANARICRGSADRFNEATLFQAWKGIIGGVDCNKILRLQ